MGLTTWKNAPDGRIRKSDVTIAKNYLSEKEVRSLELLSTAFVDIAELRAERQQLMSMKDWEGQLVKFLSINDHEQQPKTSSRQCPNQLGKDWLGLLFHA